MNYRFIAPSREIEDERRLFSRDALLETRWLEIRDKREERKERKKERKKEIAEIAARDCINGIIDDLTR